MKQKITGYQLIAEARHHHITLYGNLPDRMFASPAAMRLIHSWFNQQDFIKTNETPQFFEFCGTPILPVPTLKGITLATLAPHSNLGTELGY